MHPPWEHIIISHERAFREGVHLEGIIYKLTISLGMRHSVHLERVCMVSAFREVHLEGLTVLC